jgi:hypothetical protein
MTTSPRPDDDPRPEPPERPDDDACCGSGCDPCIFDLYAEELNRWRAELAAWESRQAARESGERTTRESAAKADKPAKPARKRNT